jgi:hypothetical protein
MSSYPLYKYTRFKLSTFMNLTHCSTCWAIKSTEIDDEFLSFISTRDLNSQPSGIRSLLYLLSYQVYRDWWWVIILYKHTRFKLSTFKNLVHCPLFYLLSYQVYRNWWWVLILYKYTIFQLSIFRNVVHCSTCWAIKSTEIGHEFLSFINTRDLNSQPSGI